MDDTKWDFAIYDIDITKRAAANGLSSLSVQQRARVDVSYMKRLRKQNWVEKKMSILIPKAIDAARNEETWRDFSRKHNPHRLGRRCLNKIKKAYVEEKLRLAALT